MAGYAFKYVRDLIPPFVVEAIDEYEGDPNYDGDMWCATADYIGLLEAELAAQFKMTGKLHDARLYQWLTGRPVTLYCCSGPAITK